MTSQFDITGTNMDAHEVSKRINAEPNAKKNRGESLYPGTKVQRVMQWGLLSYDTTKKDRESFLEQVESARAFLTTHYDALVTLQQDPTIELITLTFIVETPSEIFYRSNYLPPDIIKLLADIKAAVEFTITESYQE